MKGRAELVLTIIALSGLPIALGLVYSLRGSSPSRAWLLRAPANPSASIGPAAADSWHYGPASGTPDFTLLPGDKITWPKDPPDFIMTPGYRVQTSGRSSELSESPSSSPGWQVGGAPYTACKTVLLEDGGCLAAGIYSLNGNKWSDAERVLGRYPRLYVGLTLEPGKLTVQQP
jgi:hypothetical protein